MNKISEERRAYPRVKTNLKVNVSKGILGNSIDLSESGLSFNYKETVSGPNISLKIQFPGRTFELKTDARIIWQRNLEEGISLYGAEFLNLNEYQQSVLREQLMRIQINGLLNEIKSSDIKNRISSFFLNDILGYIKEIIKLTSVTLQQKSYSLELEKKFDHLNTQVLLKGYCLEELLTDKKIMQKVKDNFRQLVGTWIYKSAIVKRAFEKPLGYPGDYKMLEIVYDNKPISTLLGEYFDNNFLKSPYAVTVRIRKDRLKELLLNFINEPKLGKINILNIACGSCREIRELLPSIKINNPIVFSCLDWDGEALKFSEDTLSQVAPRNARFKFIKKDVMNIIKDENVSQSLGKQSLVYSIGLIDYLPDRVLKKLIWILYQLLEKGGKLILTHKNKEKTFPPLPPDWFCDWKFVARNKEEVRKLFYSCGISDFSLFESSDDFEFIYYFTLIKR